MGGYLKYLLKRGGLEYNWGAVLSKNSNILNMGIPTENQFNKFKVI